MVALGKQRSYFKAYNGTPGKLSALEKKANGNGSGETVQGRARDPALSPQFGHDRRRLDGVPAGRPTMSTGYELLEDRRQLPRGPSLVKDHQPDRVQQSHGC